MQQKLEQISTYDFYIKILIAREKTEAKHLFEELRQAKIRKDIDEAIAMFDYQRTFHI